MNLQHRLRKQVNLQKQSRITNLSGRVTAVLMTTTSILVGVTPFEHMSLPRKFLLILILNWAAEGFRMIHRVPPASKGDVLDVQNDVETLKLKIRALERKLNSL